MPRLNSSGSRTMGSIVEFVPRADRDAKANLDDFIRMARNDLTAFGADGAWKADRWQQGKTVVLFSAKSTARDSYTYTPMADPFRQFAKAYIRYSYSHRPVVSLAMPLQALRCIEAALIECCGCADILLLRGASMDVSAQKCREFYVSEDVWHKTGLVMQHIFEFCRTKRFVPSLPQWKSPFKKPIILTEDVGAEGKAHRDAKLPTNAAMLAVADVFAAADDAETRFYSAIIVLLMVAPNRISEVLELPVDCIGWEEDGQGECQMYLRWLAAKGKGPMKKWVIPAMQGVVEEAVRRLTEMGEPARRAAKFAFENPGRFMRHQGCASVDEVPEDEPLTPEEFCTAMMLRVPPRCRTFDGAPKWSVFSNTKWIVDLVADGSVTYGKLADYVRKCCCGYSWPFIDEAKSVSVWDALCLHRENEFHDEFPVKPFSWRLAQANEVNARLDDSKGLSLFEKRGLKNPDGTSIKLTTHQLRHWLSTLSERAGMDDHTLAQWAGRADATHNRHYDHRTPEEQLEVAREILQIDHPSILERLKDRQPVSYQELGVDRLGTAKATLYGMCVHDYAMAPCQKQRECMTCKEHVCIKGDHVTLDRIKILEDQTALLLERAQRAHEDGFFGADRWVDNHKWKLAHVRTMRMLLEQPDVADGTVFRIPEGHDPSPVQRALMDMGVIPTPSSEVMALPVSVATLPGKGDA